MDPLSLRPIALAVAQEHSVAVVLSRIVDGLCEQPAVALARVWLIGPGDVCTSCRLRVECPDQTRCLHLAASAGGSKVAPDADCVTSGWGFPPLPAGRDESRSYRGERRGAPRA